MARKKLLLLGESWVTSATHYKGFDQFGSTTYHLGAEPFVAALKDRYDVDYMPSHLAATDLPLTAEGIARWDVIVISDIGANTLLLHPDVWLKGEPRPNRLKLIRDWTHAGGGLAMFGGYLTFQGIDGRGRWNKTAVETALPVTCLPYDDRVEVPDGFKPVVTGAADHPILQGLGTDWPALLGANEVILKDGAEVLATLPEEEGGYPLLVTGEFGKGRTLAWTSDVGPHWLPNAFVQWPGYARLWNNVADWLSRQI